MKVVPVSTSANNLNNVNPAQQNQNVVIEKSNTDISKRKRSIRGGFGFISAVVSGLATPKITDIVFKKMKPKASHLSINARIGAGIFALGILAGVIFSKIDQKRNTKLGDFFDNMNKKYDEIFQKKSEKESVK